MNGDDKIIPITEIDQGALAVARVRIEAGAKTAVKAAQQLAEKIEQAEQLALFGDYPFEPAMFLPSDELRKRYTGEQAEKVEYKRNACIRMLAHGIPAQDIAKDLQMNLRTIAALAAQNGKMLAGFTDKFAGELMSSAAADIALAETKREEASHKDLHIAAGIKMQHAMALKMITDTGPAPIEIEAENGRLNKLREKIRQLKPATATP